MKKAVKLILFAAGLSSLAACSQVSPDKMKELERMAQRALNEAQTATSRADNALSVASEAEHTANQARNKAEAALRCCNENSAKIDRAFEKVTRK